MTQQVDDDPNMPPSQMQMPVEAERLIAIMAEDCASDYQMFRRSISMFKAKEEVYQQTVAGLQSQVSALTQALEQRDALDAEKAESVVADIAGAGVKEPKSARRSATG